MIFPAASAILFAPLVAFLIMVWFMKRPKNLPPGPWSLPVVGYRLGQGLIHERLTVLARQFGPIFSVRLGPQLFVVVNDGHSFRQAFVENASALSDHFVPGSVSAGVPKQYRNGSIGFSNGKIWSDLTKFCMPALRSFGFGKKSVEPSISLEARYMCEEIRGTAGAPCSFVPFSNLATANVMCQLVFGQRYEYGDEEMRRALIAMDAVVRCATPSDPAFIFPFLMKTPLYRKAREASSYLQEFISGHVKLHQKTFQKDNIRDLIDAYLADDFSKDYVVEEFWRTILDLFAGGTETIATFVSWTALFMAAHPDVQKRVHAELDAVLGRGRQPTLDDRTSLPFCDATVMEIMRHRPALPFAVPHQAVEDATVGGYNVPKGAVVIPNIWAAHHNPDEWKDPDEFCPDRFLEEDGKTLKKKNNSYLPFGIGRRECLGVQLAKMETFLFFTNILQSFEIRFPPEQPEHSLEGTAGLNLWPEPYQVCALER